MGDKTRRFNTEEEETGDLSPERELIGEVMLRAIRDLLEPEHHHFASVWIWRRYKYKPSPFSYEWCCEVLGLDAEELRKRLLSIERRGDEVRRDRTTGRCDEEKRTGDKLVRYCDPGRKDRASLAVVNGRGGRDPLPRERDKLGKFRPRLRRTVVPAVRGRRTRVA